MATSSGADGKWSWVVAASCCWVTFVIQGLVRCSGVVYVALLDAHGATRAQASWPFTLRMAVWNLSGPLAGALSYRWSIRTITIGGVLLVTVTNVICWFASDIYVITFFLGGLQGLGVGMAVTLVPVIINQYFSRYKSTGAGIACAGATAGSFALPPLVEWAVEEYGLRGAFLVMAGVTLHGVLGAALLRPARWLQTKREEEEPPLRGDQNLNFLTSKSAEALDKEEVKSLLKSSKNVLCPANGSKSTKTVRFSFNESKTSKDEPENEGTALLEDTVHPSIVRPDDSNDIPNGVQTLQGTRSNSDAESRTVVVDSNYTHILEPLSSRSPDSLAEEDQNGYFSTGKLRFRDVEDEYDPRINLKPVHLNSEPLGSSNSVYCSTTQPNPSLAEEDQNRNFSTGRLSFRDVEDEYDPQINLKPVLLKSEPGSNCPTTEYFPTTVYCPTTEPKPSRGWLNSVLVPARAACEIVSNPMFLIIASNYCVFFLSYMTYLIVIVDHSLDLGIDRTDAVFLVSTFSVADLCGRLGSGWITDGGIVERRHLMMANMVTVGGLLVATSFTATYAAVTAVSVCTGLVVGINLILFYALLEEYLGLKQLPMAVGLMNFSIGVISFVTPLLTGYFRDTMGSYDHLFHFLGGVSIFCGLLWILEPVHAACNKKTVAFEKTLPC